MTLCCLAKLVLGFILPMVLDEEATALALLGLAVATPFPIVYYGATAANPFAKKVGGARLLGAAIGVLIGGPLVAYCGSSIGMGSISLFESYRNPQNRQEINASSVPSLYLFDTARRNN